MHWKYLLSPVKGDLDRHPGSYAREAAQYHGCLVDACLVLVVSMFRINVAGEYDHGDTTAPGFGQTVRLKPHAAYLELALKNRGWTSNLVTSAAVQQHREVKNVAFGFPEGDFLSGTPRCVAEVTCSILCRCILVNIHMP